MRTVAAQTELDAADPDVSVRVVAPQMSVMPVALRRLLSALHTTPPEVRVLVVAAQTDEATDEPEDSVRVVAAQTDEAAADPEDKVRVVLPQTDEATEAPEESVRVA